MSRVTGKSWIKPRPEYYVQTGGMHENPYGVPRDEILRMILEDTPEVVAQVVFGKYVESSGLVFSGEIIQQMIDRSTARVNGNYYVDQTAVGQAKVQLERYREWLPRWYTGVDFARQTDYTVITTIDTLARPARAVYFKRLHRVPWETIYTEVGKARQLFGPHILCDSTGMAGDVILDALHSRGFCVQHQTTVVGRCLDPRTHQPLGCDPESYLPMSCVEGYSFQQGPKRQLIEHLRNTMSVGYRAEDPTAPFGWLRVPPIVQLEEELAFYAWEDKKLTTDCLMSLALAAWHGLEDPAGELSYGSVYGT